MKFSIITVCYNSVKTIEQTIQSVLRQDYDELEYIIVDGGSTDGTTAVIEQYRKKISVYISEPDRGLYDAMNKGINRASGDVVAFLNSDDWYERGTLEKVREYFNRNEVDIVSGNMYMWTDRVCSRYGVDRKNRENVFFESIYPQPALFVKRELYLRFGGFDLSYKVAADTKWIMNAYVNGAEILCVDDCFTYFRYGGISTVREYEALEEQYRAALACLQGKGLKQLEGKINAFYTSECRKMRKVKEKEAFRNAMEDRKAEVRELFDQDTEYYIWGAGMRGALCLDIFETLGLPVAGFIDSCAAQKKVTGYPVIFPEEINSDYRICITPKNHEKEIMDQLKNMGISEDRYFTYFDMFESIAKLGK